MADPDANPSPVPAPRASDSDREAAARTLRDAAGEGRIDFAELEQRLDAVYAARTQTDLVALTADLPAATVSASAPAPALVLQVKSGTVKRKGYWRVPAHIDAECTSGTVKLDFTEADCPHREVTINVSARSGAVVLIVPIGWTVDMDAASATSGAVVNKMRGRPEPGTPVLKVSGTVLSGTIKARPPRRSFRDWLGGRQV